jgi:putative phosphoserine phosphatase/1-acylglycerol-3-phosphate O-acyltransferase
MQARVPMVPIVIRNAGDVMWRNSMFVRSGQVDVAVLPPVSTRRWTVQNLPLRVAEMERLFAETLENWPGDGAPSLSSLSSSERSASPAGR